VPTPQIPEAIRRLFLETFTARDIAEPLASFDAGASSAEVRKFMESRDFDVVGIRHEGVVTGHVSRESLAGGPCGQYAVPVTDAVVRDESTPLLNTLLELNLAPFLLITLLGNVGGIVTSADLQKPPVRMWLFGIVTLIEMRFAHLIERHCPDDAWMNYLSESRLQKAQALLSERHRRNQAVRLFDCLQFSDKATIIASHEDIRKSTVFASRRQAEQTARKVETLRNSLAHAQEIVDSDWEIIVRLCEFITQ
jgi:hypothetical protein